MRPDIEAARRELEQARQNLRQADQKATDERLRVDLLAAKLARVEYPEVSHLKRYRPKAGRPRDAEDRKKRLSYHRMVYWDLLILHEETKRPIINNATKNDLCGELAEKLKLSRDSIIRSYRIGKGLKEPL